MMPTLGVNFGMRKWHADFSEFLAFLTTFILFKQVSLVVDLRKLMEGPNCVTQKVPDDDKKEAY